MLPRKHSIHNYINFYLDRVLLHVRSILFHIVCIPQGLSSVCYPISFLSYSSYSFL
nr:MAG TPA: hypothetical protein [Siphoviridae sp. ctEup56]